MRRIEAEDAPGLMRDDLDRLGPLLRTLGASYLVVIDDVYTDLFTGDAIDPGELDDGLLGALVDNLQRLAADARDRFGLQTVVHPHAETHVEYERQIVRLLDDTDPALVGICLDTGHHAYRGGDPVAFLRRHADRIPYLHVKSIDPAMQRRVAAEGIPFARPSRRTCSSSRRRAPSTSPSCSWRCARSTTTALRSSSRTCSPRRTTSRCPSPRRTREYLREIGLG